MMTLKELTCRARTATESTMFEERFPPIEPKGALDILQENAGYPREMDIPECFATFTTDPPTDSTDHVGRTLRSAIRPNPLRALGDVKMALTKNETEKAIGQLADIIVQTGQFLCLGGALYRYRPPIWVLLDGEHQITLAFREVVDSEMLDGLSKKRFRDLIFRVKTNEKVQFEGRLRKNQDLMAFKDDVLDFIRDKFREARADDYLFSRLNVCRHEIGCGDGGYFEGFLEHLSGGDSAIRELLLEVLGVILSGYRPRRIFLFLGPPRTGKSQVVNLLRRIIGDEGVHSVDSPADMADRWTTGSLVGKKLCVCPDVENHIIPTKAVAIMKQISGGDAIRAEQKYRQPFSFVSDAAVLLVSNHPLRFQRDSGFEERLVTVPFHCPVNENEAIPDFSELLYRERGYVVQMALEALRKLRHRNFVFTAVNVPAMDSPNACVGSLDEVIADFAKTRLDFADGTATLTSQIYGNFCDFCTQNGLEPEAYTTFARVFAETFPMLRRVNRKSGRGFCGVHLREHVGGIEEDD